jgi:hypothetical protein
VHGIINLLEQMWSKWLLLKQSGYSRNYGYTGTCTMLMLVIVPYYVIGRLVPPILRLDTYCSTLLPIGRLVTVHVLCTVVLDMSVGYWVLWLRILAYEVGSVIVY